jgi:hypothetical protein
MNVSTRHELQTILDNIRVTQGTAEGSSLAYRVAWMVLVVTPLIGLIMIPRIGAPFSELSVFILLPFFVQSLYTIIQFKVNQRLRPIVEALLFMPEESVKQEEQRPKVSAKSAKTRPRRGGRR